MRAFCFLIVLAWLSTACSEDESSEADASGGAPETATEVDQEGLAQCCEIGALCHVTGDQSDQQVRECHILGHRNEPKACREQYEHCMEVCEGATEEPVEHSCR